MATFVEDGIFFFRSQDAIVTQLILLIEVTLWNLCICNKFWKLVPLLPGEGGGGGGRVPSLGIGETTGWRRLVPAEW